MQDGKETSLTIQHLRLFSIPDSSNEIRERVSSTCLSDISILDEEEEKKLEIGSSRENEN